MEAAADRLEVKIIQARGLKEAPNGELPTPYVEVDVGPDSFRTRHLVETRDPYWNSSTMTFHSLLGHEVDQILIKVRHKDIFSGKDAILGVVSVPMATYYGSPKTEIDAWYDLLDNSGGNDASGNPGKIRTRITYFNELDEDVLEKYSGDKPKAPNLLEVTVMDAIGLAGGRATEPFVVVQVGDLKKETRVAKKSNAPSWEESITLPVTKGDEMIDITVKQSALLRSLFLGRIRIPMNEVAAAGDAGMTKRCQLLNELLVFDQDGGNGEINLKLRWFFDQATDDELKKKIESKAGMFARLKKFILRKKDKGDGVSNE
jgi:Ca2+-dependent lipid-binding protein